MRAITIFGYAATAFLMVVAVPRGASAVKTPEERQTRIDLVGEWLSRKPIALDERVMEEIGNPFIANSVVEETSVAEEFEGQPEVVKKSALSDEELLPVLSQEINPTGIFAIGGEHILMIGEKRLRAGNVLVVKYEDVEYNVEIIGVLRNAYTLRLGDAELEIKLK